MEDFRVRSKGRDDEDKDKRGDRGRERERGPEGKSKRSTSPKDKTSRRGSNLWVPRVDNELHVFEDVVGEPEQLSDLKQLEDRATDEELIAIMRAIEANVSDKRDLHDWHLALVIFDGEKVLAWSGAQRAYDAIVAVAKRFRVILWAEVTGIDDIPGSANCALPRALAVARKLGGNLKTCKLAEQFYSVDKKTKPNLTINHATSCPTCSKGIPPYIFQ